MEVEEVDLILNKDQVNNNSITHHHMDKDSNLPQVDMHPKVINLNLMAQLLQAAVSHHNLVVNCNKLKLLELNDNNHILKLPNSHILKVEEVKHHHQVVSSIHSQQLVLKDKVKHHIVILNRLVNIIEDNKVMLQHQLHKETMPLLHQAEPQLKATLHLHIVVPQHKVTLLLNLVKPQLKASLLL
jgi:hypothetical protein